jgi:hypothetical protein
MLNNYSEHTTEERTEENKAVQERKYGAAKEIDINELLRQTCSAGKSITRKSK